MIRAGKGYVEIYGERYDGITNFNFEIERTGEDIYVSFNWITAN